MELVLKRYFWTVWLVAIALSAWLIARTANVFVGAALEPVPSLGGGPLSRPSVLPAARAALDTTRVGHLFGIEPPPAPAAAEEAPEAGPSDTNVCFTCAPVKTNLRLQLLATMVANEKQWSMSLIHDLDRQETAYYFVGDRVKNAKVHDIVRDPQRVIIVNDETHRLEYIDSVPGSGAVNTAGLGSLGTAALPGPDAVADAAPTDDLPEVKQRSENEYMVPKARLDATLANLSKVATEARIVPSFKNGVANGFKLFSIRPGSIYSSIGVQNGDVITRINGFDINSPDKALEIYQRLKDARNVEIQVERRGQLVTKRYSIE